MHSSLEPNWRTPSLLFAKLCDEFRFNLDAAADRESRLTQTWLGPGSAYEDALGVAWRHYVDDGFGNTVVFLNPPYSRILAAAYTTGRIKTNGAWQEHPIDLQKAQALRIENWAAKCWHESQQGCTIVGIFPFAPQTSWYRKYVFGHDDPDETSGSRAGWNGHAAMEERRLTHRISFLTPEGKETNSAGVNHAVIIWRPNPGYVGPWQPAIRYWTYR